jgi:citrate lyase subunit beta / citryl-CoA lyase
MASGQRMRVCLTGAAVDRASMVLFRSLLFVPGDNASKLRKASGTATDAIITDWEDAVLPAQKAAARQTTIQFLRERTGTPPLLIRINPANSTEFAQDLAAIGECATDGIALSKCRSASDVLQLAAFLDGIGARSFICPFIESAAGLVNASAIATASERVTMLAFGAEDLSAELQVHRSVDEVELLYARSAVVVASRAAGKEPIDSPYVAYRDFNGLHTAAQRARNLGFSGKLAIHPDQIPIINEAFSPSEAEITEAGRVVEAYRAGGTGALGVDGRMIDEAIVRRARIVIDLAQGRREDPARSAADISAQKQIRPGEQV